MEGAAVSAATGAIKTVLGKLNAFLGDEFTLPEGSQSDIELIISKLKPMHSVLPGIWGREDIYAPCKDWMMEVRELSYDTEDAIDDFIQRRTNTRPFEDLKIKVNDVSERFCEKWKTAETISNSSKPVVVDPRARFLHKDALELEGMDILKDELIELLVQGFDKRRDASRRRIGTPRHRTTQGTGNRRKRKIVIKVQMASDEIRFKQAMAVLAATVGVDSVTLAGDGRDWLVVVGSVDSIQLTSALRKVGHAQLVHVGTSVDTVYEHPVAVCGNMIVIKVQMESDMSRSEAVRLAAETDRVQWVKLAGDGRDLLMVVGWGVDPVNLISVLQKKVGYACVVSVGPSQPAPANAVYEHPVAACGNQQFDEVKMVCILGFAGGGKTTLADLLYHAMREQFQFRAFVSVSRSPNMTDILRAILTEVTNETYAGTEAVAEQYLIDNLSNFLADKRYLVIIDDIWHWEEWEIIRKSLPKNNLGSRIIMTTRINAIAEKCRTDDKDAFVYEIGPLDSWGACMLSDRVVKKSVTSDRLGIMEDYPYFDIVQMCYGLPLALICMSSALVEQIQGLDGELKIWRALRRVEDGILNIASLKPLAESLCLGYDDLPLRLRTFLLYCSIYRWHNKFERHSLVRKWIAEGFVCEEEAADCLTKKEEAADCLTKKEKASQACFVELVDREWIKPVGGSKYEIHPMMLAFLRCKSQDDNFVTCLGFCSDISSSCTRRIRRLSLQPGHSVDLSGMELSHARSLVVFHDAITVPFKRFERLRVLELEDVKYLENYHLVDICGLQRLRYLGLKGTPISELPPQIGGLQHLETLDVRDTKVRELPPQIGGLQWLRYLGLKGTPISELPRQIGGLQHLETLDVRDAKVRELPPQIGGLQWLRYLGLKGTPISKLPPQIGGLQHLETLDVRDTKVTELPWEAGQISKSVRVLAGDKHCRQGVKLPEGVCQDLKKGIPVSSLAKCREVLSIVVFDRFGLGTVPPLVGVFKVPGRHMHIPLLFKQYFRVISSLDIRLCKLEEDDVEFVGKEMPNLQTLVVRFEVLPREPIPISGEEGFARLESFCVDSRVPRVTFGPGAMPKLKLLAFKFYAGPASEDPVGITYLPSLERVVFRCSPWYKSDSPGISKTIGDVRREAEEHPNWITLCINDKEEILPEKLESAQVCRDENRDAGSSGAIGIEAEADTLPADRNSLAGNDKQKEVFHDNSYAIASCSRTGEIEEVEAIGLPECLPS